MEGDLASWKCELTCGAVHLRMFNGPQSLHLIIIVLLPLSNKLGCAYSH